jgi:SAM-dependent methyltransferase
MYKRALNIGSGQRRFESTPDTQWINVDVVSRPPDQVPDLVCDAFNLSEHFPDNSIDYVVLHHVAEHFGCGDAPFRSCYNVLKPGGSLLVFVPDIKALAIRWLNGGLSDFIYIVNLMGAYQGLESDRHKWHFTPDSLTHELKTIGEWSEIKPYDWRGIPGGDFARDFWVLAYEAVK